MPAMQRFLLKSAAAKINFKMSKQSISPEALALIEELELQPHPEGGWYRQTFRDSDAGSRGASTAIYYLLAGSERSHWHRVHDAAEIWHFYKGAPLKLSQSHDGLIEESAILGIDIASGERPQLIVPANSWQSAQSLGEYTLVGCTVAPGFEFSSFEMAPPNWQPGKA
jgi:predicted cupin superfamily sugar epimerase